MKYHYTPTPLVTSKKSSNSEIEAMFGVGLVLLAYVTISIGAFKFGIKHFGEAEGTVASMALALGLFKPTFKTVKALISSFNH